MADFNPVYILENFGFKSISDVNIENVNDVWRNPFFTPTLLDMVVPYMPAFTKFIPHLLSLGAKITQDTLRECHSDCIIYLLENSDIDLVVEPAIVYRAIRLSRSEKTVQRLIDYGIRIPDTLLIPPEKAELVAALREYASQSDARVVASRKALAALIICCKRGFFPLRDVGVALAKEMWAQRSPAEGGCGPRAHAWPKGKR